MRKRLRLFGKNSRGFTLMECVCAIAIVGLLAAVLLPLTSSAIISMRASDSLRKASMEAAKQNATTATVLTGDGKNVQTLYVSVHIYGFNGLATRAESAFVFTKSEATGNYDVKVTYYDLKYGNEMADPEIPS